MVGDKSVTSISPNLPDLEVVFAFINFIEWVHYSTLWALILSVNIFHRCLISG